MADVKWIKIVTNIFDNRKIRQIEKLPDADSIIIIWFKILCLAGELNENGLITLTKDVPYTDEMLANEFGKELSVVRMALRIFEQFDMIEVINDIYCVSNWEKYQNTDGLEKIREQTRKRVAEHRKRQKLLISESSNVTCNVTLTQCNATDKEIDKEKDIDIYKEKNKKKKGTDLDKVLNEKIQDEDLKTALYDFIKMRKTIKKPLTTRGLELAIKDLNKLSSSKEEQILIINKSIFNAWQGLFPLKDEDKKQLQQPKEYKESTVSEEEYYKKIKNGGQRYG